ncbi:hypothetical protein DPM19_10375 [Actinomadura craniellae]|uniref:Uncharacterized protein n=1 Tax=Actinomadura craniellae TaxID=2231787 RepID=A0A365H7N9_9ACTN|nr:hypothetical protein [Actinomadura craniellae]RAY15125.1 hypothetical protein DPM19_10375 [Actinomadura craniellae]
MSGREETSGDHPAPEFTAPPGFGQSGAPVDAESPSGAQQPGPGPLEVPPLGGPNTPWWAASEDENENAAGPPPGTLVAGIGVPSVDSRGAVPAEPLVEPPPSAYPDTDPDGIPVVDTSNPPAEPSPEPPAFPASPVPETGTADESAAPPQGGPKSGPESIWGLPKAPAPPAPEPAEEAPAEPAGEPVAGTVRSDDADSAETEPVQQVGAPFPEPAAEPPASWIAAQAAESRSSRLSSESSDPLTPDAIVLPRRPGSGGGNRPGPGGGKPALIVPAGAPSRPAAAPAVNRRPLLIGGAVLAGLLVAVFAFVGLGGGDDEKGRQRQAGAQVTPEPSAAAPAAPPASPSDVPAPVVDINNERTDRQPLTLQEVFPPGRIILGGRTYTQDKTSVNHQCSLASRGAMAAALQRNGCRKVVRATYIDSSRRYAVTTGVAVLPTHAAALRVNQAGDPSRYEWFRGMPGAVARKMDQAGGFAASTVRGRYLIYSYAQYADGTRLTARDTALRAIAREFIPHFSRPIDQRAA